ncbi:MAG: hypothetical protein K9W42_10365 [Candidatus Heimdallarchaeota archaeon]|nr:hypothetical protein [Candidatus Heimdallarchaeota archaeon]
MLILKSFWVTLTVTLLAIIYIYIKTHIIAKVAFTYETMNKKYIMGLLFLFTAIEFIKLTILYSESLVLIIQTFFSLIIIKDVSKTDAEMGVLTFTGIFLVILGILIFYHLNIRSVILPAAFFSSLIDDEFFYPKKVDIIIQKVTTVKPSINERIKKTANILGYFITIGVSIALISFELYILFAGATQLTIGLTYTYKVMSIIELIGALMVAINFFLIVKVSSTEKYVYFPTISTTLATPLPQTTMEPIR